MMWALVTLACAAAGQCEPITVDIFQSATLCEQAQAPADGWHAEVQYCVIILPVVRK